MFPRTALPAHFPGAAAALDEREACRRMVGLLALAHDQERTEERLALEWLERQPPPAVHASGHTARTTPEVFVPPNDSATPARDLGQLKWYRDYLARGILV